MEIELENLQDGYVELCRDLLKRGKPVDVRGFRTLEMLGVTLIFNDLKAPMLPIGVGRGVNTKLAAVEALSMIGCTSAPELIKRAAPNYTDVLVGGDDDLEFDYSAYGLRIRDQMNTVVQMLRDDPTTRQALLSIWRPRDLVHKGDKPCTITLQFFRRGSALDLHVYMRSQDVWLGTSLDVFVFTQLMWTVAMQVGVFPRQYVHHMGSFHTYERDWGKLLALQVSAITPDLPFGVRIPDDNSLLSSSHAATMLLHYGPQCGKLSRINTWYARQMGRVYDDR
jgi:thymidylate synthase